jgi:hypothetical protein
MAKFGSVKKLSVDEIPTEHRGWFGKVLEGLNPFIQQTSTALSNGLVLADNSRTVKFTTTITTSPTWPMKYNLKDLKERPTAVLIGSLKSTDGFTITAAYCVHWAYDNGQLSYTILGLDSAHSYSATLIAII